MFGKGKHTSRELIRRLRSENRFHARQAQLMQKRIGDANALLRTETVQKELAEGLVLRQTAALQKTHDRIAELERELAERTVEMELPKAPELAEAIA